MNKILRKTLLLIVSLLTISRLSFCVDKKKAPYPLNKSQTLTNKSIEWYFKTFKGLQMGFVEMMDPKKKATFSAEGKKISNEIISKNKEKNTAKGLFSAAHGISYTGPMKISTADENKEYLSLPSHIPIIAYHTHKICEDLLNKNSTNEKPLKILCLGAGKGGLGEIAALTTRTDLYTVSNSQSIAPRKVIVFYNESHGVSYNDFIENINKARKNQGLEINSNSIEFVPIIGNFNDNETIQKFKEAAGQDGFDLVIAFNCLYYNHKQIPGTVAEISKLIKKDRAFIAASTTNFGLALSEETKSTYENKNRASFAENQNKLQKILDVLNTTGLDIFSDQVAKALQYEGEELSLYPHNIVNPKGGPAELGFKAIKIANVHNFNFNTLNKQTKERISIGGIHTDIIFNEENEEQNEKSINEANPLCQIISKICEAGEKEGQKFFNKTIEGETVTLEEQYLVEVDKENGNEKLIAGNREFYKSNGIDFPGPTGGTLFILEK